MNETRKIFLSADIEGTASIADRLETDCEHPTYPPFAARMTREVAAACEGVLAGGASEVLVKDAHATARNIDPEGLPEEGVRLFRGWSRDPLLMMAGLDKSFYGAMMTGYHSAAGIDANPLAHTMSGQYTYFLLNGHLCSESELSCLAAAWLGVPILLLTGDRALCEWLGTQNPEIPTVATLEGRGAGTISEHPKRAARRIREAAERAMSLNPAKLHFPQPAHYRLEVRYRDHTQAERNSYFPGAIKGDAHTVAFASDDYYEILRFILFCA